MLKIKTQVQKYKKSLSNCRAGFTLVELMVVITIMLIITSISFYNYTAFRSQTLISSLAYDISLAIRQAQLYGVSGRGTDASITPISATSDLSGFTYAYGVSFDAINNPTQFKIFADTNGDGFYTAIPSDETVQTYALQAGTKISSVCVTSNSVCAAADTVRGPVAILFKRPESRILVSYTSGGVTHSEVLNMTVQITVQSSDHSLSKVITISPLGQISIN